MFAPDDSSIVSQVEIRAICPLGICSHAINGQDVLLTTEAEMKALVVSISIAIATATASACSAETAMMTGAGTSTCGQFASRYAQNPESTEQFYFSWAQGFMTSMNICRASGSSPAYRDLSSPVELQMSHIRIYCDAHPLALYSQAIIDLFGSFPLMRASQSYTSRQSDRNRRPASGLCRALASSHGARIHTSRSSSVVRITGIALG
jgi:hypothetical protein